MREEKDYNFIYYKNINWKDFWSWYKPMKARNINTLDFGLAKKQAGQK